MKNLENYKFTELSMSEMKKTNGGVLWFVYVFGLGIAYGYVSEKLETNEN